MGKWEMVPLQNIASLMTDGDWIESKDQSLNGVRLLQVGNIGKGLFVDKLDRAKFISEDTFNRLKCTEVLEDDILISRLPDPIGRACIIPRLDERLITAVDCTIVRVNTIECDKHYLLHYLNSPYYYWQIGKFVVGSTRSRISRKNLQTISIPLPPLPVQQKIADVLDRASALIEKRKAQIEKLDLLVKSQFIEMFGDPVTNPKKWEHASLNSICDGIGDGLHGTPNYQQEGGIPFINGNNLIDGKIVITSATKSVDSSEYDKYYIDISSNAILLSINGTLGKLAFYNGEKVVLGKSACYCNLKTNVNKVFIYGLMKSDGFLRFLENSATKSTIKNVGLKAMRDFQVIQPPLPSQRKYSDFVQTVESQKSLLQQSLAKMEQNYKSLMQKCFRGEIF